MNTEYAAWDNDPQKLEDLRKSYCPSTINATSPNSSESQCTIGPDGGFRCGLKKSEFGDSVILDKKHWPEGLAALASTQYMSWDEPAK